jgi:hypothetical protein
MRRISQNRTRDKEAAQGLDAAMQPEGNICGR